MGGAHSLVEAYIARPPPPPPSVPYAGIKTTQLYSIHNQLSCVLVFQHQH